MSLQPPSMNRPVQRYSYHPVPRATQFGKMAAISSTPNVQDLAKHTIANLQGLGIPEKQAEDILKQLSLNNDKPYHAGKLWNGKVYLVSRQDTVYYGTPTQLKRLEPIQAYRTKCFDSQTRHYQTADGFSLVVIRKHDKQWAIASGSLLGMSVKLPQMRQVTFSS